MIAIQIEINGKHYAVVGAPDMSILHAEILAMYAEPNSKVRDGFLEFKAGGMTRPDSDDVLHHLRWARHPLSIGSTVTMKIIETETVDSPKKRYRSDKQVQESPFTDEEMKEMRYKDYLSLKEEFEGKPPPA